MNYLKKINFLWLVLEEKITTILCCWSFYCFAWKICSITRNNSRIPNVFKRWIRSFTWTIFLFCWRFLRSKNKILKFLNSFRKLIVLNVFWQLKCNTKYYRAGWYFTRSCGHGNYCWYRFVINWNNK